ncbi:hypothetical protein CKA32_006277 [Geitlerinema sp. FC II]|uniref:Uma2 family endonuclease n=1 Tax=Baaleninema simplex TaxID=2862350 RepID=UPI000344B5F0|nr:Uma2 family endonuclease [Baaleninema simplex]MDC0835278.1 Uma2 family endonuclease [Geitlerinema sp. CS-897]PPT07951.1 hypothetical protein CKA32_006277 [Geitlerinema sp. FC II]
MTQISPPADNSFGFVPDEAIVDTRMPVDDFASAKQKRLLTDSLYTSLRGQPFLVEANVGILHTQGQPLVVPDLILSLDVNTSWWQQRHSPYFIWQFGKSPDLVLEIVSDRYGDELGSKLATYERLRVSYYVVFDPDKLIGEATLTVYELRGKCYFEIAKIDRDGKSIWLEQVGLGLLLWQGDFEEKENLWLRWCDRESHVLPTGFELAQQEFLEREEQEKRAERAESQLGQANQRTERSKKWANRLAEQLRSLGVDPDTI